MKSRNIAAALFAIGLCTSANASLVFNGGSPSRSDALVANAGLFGFEEAAAWFSVAPGASVTFNGFSWWGVYQDTSNWGDQPYGIPNDVDNFSFKIYSASNQLPDTEMKSLAGDDFRVSSEMAGNALVADTYPEFSYRAIFDMITLTEGDYFFSLSNAYLSTSHNWAWETTSEGIPISAFGSIGGPWSPGSYCDYNDETQSCNEVPLALAFQLTVPEPGSFALLGLGLAGLAASRRRKAY